MLRATKYYRIHPSTKAVYHRRQPEVTFSPISISTLSTTSANPSGISPVDEVFALLIILSHLRTLNALAESRNLWTGSGLSFSALLFVGIAKGAQRALIVGVQKMGMLPYRFTDLNLSSVLASFGEDNILEFFHPLNVKLLSLCKK
mmetsp:Transcript_16943/g.35052  ORF Transcript_16943/g.35052 Transcript_16943/m.35052 type:complete len:146 (-) Transcript_16943:74-511(-)